MSRLGTYTSRMLVRKMMSAATRHNSLIMVDRLQGAVAIARLNRPSSLNALSDALIKELADELNDMDRDPEVRVVVLTGNEKAFADIKNMAAIKSCEEATEKQLLAMLDHIKLFRKPLIAAVDGLALGGGCELAMMCDIILASSKAEFGQPELSLGTIPGIGGTQRLIRAVGKSKAMEWILSGRRIGSIEAERAGLISRVVEPPETVEDAAVKLARSIAKFSPATVALAKECINRAMESSLEEGLRFERKAARQQGMDAFVNRQKSKLVLQSQTNTSILSKIFKPLNDADIVTDLAKSYGGLRRPKNPICVVHLGAYHLQSLSRCFQGPTTESAACKNFNCCFYFPYHGEPVIHLEVVDRGTVIGAATLHVKDASLLRPCFIGEVCLKDSLSRLAGSLFIEVKFSAKCVAAPSVQYHTISENIWSNWTFHHQSNVSPPPNDFKEDGSTHNVPQYPADIRRSFTKAGSTGTQGRAPITLSVPFHEIFRLDSALETENFTGGSNRIGSSFEDLTEQQKSASPSRLKAERSAAYTRHLLQKDKSQLSDGNTATAMRTLRSIDREGSRTISSQQDERSSRARRNELSAKSISHDSVPMLGRDNGLPTSHSKITKYETMYLGNTKKSQIACCSNSRTNCGTAQSASSHHNKRSEQHSRSSALTQEQQLKLGAERVDANSTSCGRCNGELQRKVSTPDANNRSINETLCSATALQKKMRHSSSDDTVAVDKNDSLTRTPGRLSRSVSSNVADQSQVNARQTVDDSSTYDCLSYGSSVLGSFKSHSTKLAKNDLLFRDFACMALTIHRSEGVNPINSIKDRQQNGRRTYCIVRHGGMEVQSDTAYDTDGDALFEVTLLFPFSGHRTLRFMVAQKNKAESDMPLAIGRFDLSSIAEELRQNVVPGCGLFFKTVELLSLDDLPTGQLVISLQFLKEKLVQMSCPVSLTTIPGSEYRML